MYMKAGASRFRGYIGCSMMLYGSARRLYRLDVQVTCRVFQCTGMKVHLEGSKQQGYYVWLRWSLRNTTWFKGDHKVVRNCFICTIPQQDQTCETMRNLILGFDSHRAFTIWQDAFSVLAPALPTATQLQNPKLGVKTCSWEFPGVWTTCLEDNCICAHMARMAHISNNPYAASDAFETC